MFASFNSESRSVFVIKFFPHQDHRFVSKPHSDMSDMLPLEISQTSVTLKTIETNFQRRPRCREDPGCTGTGTGGKPVSELKAPSYSARQCGRGAAVTVSKCRQTNIVEAHALKIFFKSHGSPASQHCLMVFEFCFSKWFLNLYRLQCPIPRKNLVKITISSTIIAG